jgi:hypothetical protein
MVSRLLEDRDYVRFVNIPLERKQQDEFVFFEEERRGKRK